MTNIALVIIGWTLVTNQTGQFRSQDTNGTAYVNNVYSVQEAPVIGYEKDGQVIPINAFKTVATFTNSAIANLGPRRDRPALNPDVKAAASILNTNKGERPAGPRRGGPNRDRGPVKLQ